MLLRVAQVTFLYLKGCLSDGTENVAAAIVAQSLRIVRTRGVVFEDVIAPDAQENRTYNYSHHARTQLR